NSAHDFAIQAQQGRVDPGCVQAVVSNIGHHLFLELVLGGGSVVHAFDMFEWNAQQSVLVADDQIAGLDDHSAQADRHIDFAGPVLIRSAMRDACRIHRKVAFSNDSHVAYRTIDHYARNTFSLGGAGHEFADDGV